MFYCLNSIKSRNVDTLKVSKTGSLEYSFGWCSFGLIITIDIISKLFTWSYELARWYIRIQSDDCVYKKYNKLKIHIFRIVLDAMIAHTFWWHTGDTIHKQYFIDIMIHCQIQAVPLDSLKYLLCAKTTIGLPITRRVWQAQTDRQTADSEALLTGTLYICIPNESSA